MYVCSMWWESSIPNWHLQVVGTVGAPKCELSRVWFLLHPASTWAHNQLIKYAECCIQLEILFSQPSSQLVCPQKWICIAKSGWIQYTVYAVFKPAGLIHFSPFFFAGYIKARVILQSGLKYSVYGIQIMFWYLKDNFSWEPSKIGHIFSK